MAVDTRNLLTRILDWLRAGYPEGIPHTDYVPLLTVLRRHLTDDEVRSIAGQLAEESDRTGAPVDEEHVRSLIARTAHQEPSAEDLQRVSARLAAGGWPLAPAREQAPIEGPGRVRRILDWLREGYPAGVPDTDYVPLLALLRRRLTDEEVATIAASLREEGQPADSTDIGVAITRHTQELPSRGDVERVRRHLAQTTGWTSDFPDPGDG